MSNVKLIKALRCKTSNVNDCTMCAYHNACYDGTLMSIAAAALEAANERIVNLLTALHLANEKLAYVDCQPYTEIDGEEMIEDWVKTLVYEELEAQLPKEGEWIDIDGTMFAECSVCGKRHYGCTTPYCDMCGARMKGERR